MIFPKTEKEKYFGINLKKNKEAYQKLESESKSNNDKKLLKKNKNDMLIDKFDISNIQNLIEQKGSFFNFSKKCSFLIKKDSIIKGIFDILTLILVNISSLYLLYELCFSISYKHDSKEDKIWIIAYYAIEILFVIFIILQFFQEYQDPETFSIIRDHKKIALRYIKGWFFIDIISTIPFELFVNENNFFINAKIIRLIRLPKLIQTMDVKRFDNLADSFLTSNSSGNGNKRLMLIFNMRYVFKIFRLVIIASILTYMLGCLWYFVCKKIYEDQYFVKSSKKTFFTEYSLYNQKSRKKLIICCYFVLTALTTVGYGDINAQNDTERIFGIVMMLVGVAVFSYVMSEFSDQINIYNQTFGDVDKGSLLQNWLHLLQSFSKGKKFDKNLINDIEKHFEFFWKNNRMLSVEKNNKFLVNLPKKIKVQVVDYFWGDFFKKFSNFFLYKEKINNVLYQRKFVKFYFELSFLIMPRLFEVNEIIYNQNDDVEEMYFIIIGMVEIGYKNNYNAEPKYYHILYNRDYFGGYYTLYNIRSEFVYRAKEECKLYAINKIDFLKLLKKFPIIENLMRKNVYNKFKRGVKAHMDKSIKKDFNNYDIQNDNNIENDNDNDNENENDNEINTDSNKKNKNIVIKNKMFQRKQLLDIDDNQNGMSINTILNKTIKEKNNQIKKKENELEVKYNELQNEYEEIYKEYSKLVNKVNENK